MKKSMRRLMALALSLTMILGMSITTFAAPYVSEKRTIYFSSKAQTTSGVSISFSDEKKLGKISAVKSSKPAVLEYTGYTLDTDTYDYTYYDKDGKQTGHSKTPHYYGWLNFTAKKTGTSKVTFKIGSKAYNQTVNVYKYENPIKSIKVTGVNSGKELASKFAKQNTYSAKLNKTVANSTVTVTAAKGWAVTRIELNADADKGNASRSVSFWDGGVNKGSLDLGKLTAKKYTRIYVTLYNAKTDGYQYCYIYLNSYN